MSAATPALPARCASTRADLPGLDGHELSTRRATELRTHLADCPDCAALAASYRSVRRTLADLHHLSSGRAQIVPLELGALHSGSRCGCRVQCRCAREGQRRDDQYEPRSHRDLTGFGPYEARAPRAFKATPMEHEPV